MAGASAKADLQRYLQVGRDVVVWKLDGLGEYDVRRPLVPTGTNLLGLVKHLAMVEAGYFGLVFDRPLPGWVPWWEEADREPDSDMWATADESREDVVGFYRRVWEHADATIEALELDAAGHVPWWPPEKRDVTLHRILVHVATETHRHAGHADVIRELVDGAVGFRRDSDNMAPGDADWWSARRERLEQVARDAAST